MSDTRSTRSRSLLLYGGLLLLVVGAGIAFVAHSIATRDANVAEFAAAYGGRMIDVYPDYTGMWIGIVITAVGAVALLVFVGGRSSKAESPPTV